MLRGKNIVLAITGGIAAYKSAVLARLLVKSGAEVQVIMTPNAKEFITPLTLSTLTGRPVISEFFTANTGEWHSHVDLGLWADAFVVAPATASTLAKMATGVADNMVVTSYLSTRAKTFVAPAMDLDMMAHPSTTRNLNTLEKDGVFIIEPGEGELASHLTGKGRMAEPEEIVEVLRSYFERSGSLRGQRVLVTAGPTYELIDPVRFVGNFSSGKMGFAIAEELASRGADVELVSGPVALSISSPRIRRHDVTSAREMHQVCMSLYGECNAGIMTAAVADYAPAKYAESKIKREKKESMNLELVKNPDIAASLGAEKKEGQFLIGFALETDDEEVNAARKLSAKNLDWIVLNSLRDKDAGFGKDTNRITMYSAKGDKLEFEPKLKRDVAKDIIDTVFGKK